MNRPVYHLPRLVKLSTLSMRAGNGHDKRTIAPFRYVHERLRRCGLGACIAICLLVALGIAGCTSQDQQILTQTRVQKIETLALMDKAKEPYDAHAQEIADRNARLEQLYDQERRRPGNGPTTQMWATLLHVDPSLPGSGIYPRFLEQWKKKNVLSPVYIEDKKQNVAEAFDKIISLESAKPQR